MKRQEAGQGAPPPGPKLGLRPRPRRVQGGALAFLLAFIPTAHAQVPCQLAPVVVDVSPLGGGIRLSTWPQAVRVLGKADLARHGKADAVGALEDQVAGVNVVNSQANPYQPTILFHGFEMSPIQGTPAGLSVYVNGARFNAPFGDLAIWSVLPPEAMQSVSLEDGNPVFGLNALGGALSVKMKDGFSAPGGEAEVSGGSFGQIAGNLEYGGRVGDEAAYVDVGASHEAGWRDAQSSDVQSFYADLGWRGAAAELHVNATLAHSALAGPGTVPVQVLAAQPGAQFTGPNSISDKYFKLAATLNDRVRDDFSVQSVVYDTNLREQLVNGNGPNDLPCGPGPDAAYLCANGQVSMARGGAPIPDFLPSANADGYYSYAQLNLNTTNTNGYGASVQATYTPPLQHVVAGASFDGGFTGYDAAGYIGGITQGSRVYYTPAGIPSPGYELDEPGTVPVGVLIRNEYEGLFVSDTVTVTPALSITAGGRWNVTEIALHNQDAPDPNAPGGGLNGGHFYEHANPAVGAAYQFAPALTLYGGYSVENAAPTPAELSCASPADSCSLANFMSGDPALKQIVSRNFEAGLRGAVAALRYDADVFDNIAQDDIEFLQSPYNPIGSGYFSNVGNVHRRGVDASVHVDEARWQVYASYSYTEATYGSSFVEQSNNPGADANGNIFVQKGDYLPGVPRQTVKFGGNFWVTPAWQLGVTAHGQSAVFLYGDEANLTAPLPGFLVFDLTTKYQLTKAVQLFVDADNVTDRHYYNYGTFSPVGGVYVAAAPNFNNPRSYSVAAPIAVVTGLKLDF